MPRPVVNGIVISLALATVMHVDWHLARPAHQQLSLGLPWHWLIAAPVFALVAWYVARVWPSHPLPAASAIIGSAVLMAGVLEPAWEYFIDDAPFEWAFGRARVLALAAFVATGVVSFCLVLAIAMRDRWSRVAG